MDVKSIKKTLQYVIDEILPDSDHNITSLDLSQSQCDDEFILNFTLILKNENENKVGFKSKG